MIKNVIMKKKPTNYLLLVCCSKRVPVKSLRTRKRVALKKGSDALTKNLYPKRPL